MTLIKDLISIPESVQRGDFVLRLSEGVQNPQQTLHDYVVTPELAKCYKDALLFVQGAMTSSTSKACFLHGSFGSGKSHFMAVLHLILQNNTDAKSISELAEAVTAAPKLAGKKFLLVPFHMISAHDMESAILGGYVDFVRRKHPEAPVPGVYLAEGLFRDARGLRETMGDATFFRTLSDQAGGGGWGTLGEGWDADRFDTAMDEPPGHAERTALIGALIAKFFGAYDSQASGRGEAFVSLEVGLSIISEHAKVLGYDGLILFLDELILWLASRAANLSFVQTEGQKLVKLVEDQQGARAIPVISFVARQRDLRELIGDVPGSEKLNFNDMFRHWEGRFHTIKLEDRNLAAIAEKRILRPKNEIARNELNAAFEKTKTIREQVMKILLTRHYSLEEFRRTYPFSPALIETLIAVSSVLQRERTALKVMVQLLVEQKETLRVGDIVPVGDLFDVIAHGDEAFSPDMAIHFENAKRLYHQKLLPLLESQLNSRAEDMLKLPYDDPKRVNFRIGDRLIKTLLLAALVPQVESLRALTAERLAALNHGTIRSPIPGAEAQQVLSRCREWATQVGEVRIGAEANPVIGVQITGVDTQRIIDQAIGIDNYGNRVRYIKDLLFSEIVLLGQDQFNQYRELLWRNTRRRCDVLFKNVRELPDESLSNRSSDWKVIIDYPFDEQGHGPRDDISRIQDFKSRNPGGTRTLCWLPSFLSVPAERDLATLVILEHILTGENFGRFTQHLSVEDQQAARATLENQRSALRERVKMHVLAAYGLGADNGSLDPARTIEVREKYISLLAGFTPEPPPAATLAKALDELVGQALGYDYPAAPSFGEEVKATALNKVVAPMQRASEQPQGRLLVEKEDRPILRHIAQPLLLGEMGVEATHFVLGHHWMQHFQQKSAATEGVITVKRLREWIDQPRAMGLPREAQNLIILTFAWQTNRSFFRHGGPFGTSIKEMPDECELRTEQLPEHAIWQEARNRAASLFGISDTPEFLNSRNVGMLASKLKEKATDPRRSIERYHDKLRDWNDLLEVPVAASHRLKTAGASLALIRKLADASPPNTLSAFVGAEIQTSIAAMGECISKAAELLLLLETGNAEIFLAAEQKSPASHILADLRSALQADEHAIPLGPSLKELQARSLRIITESPPPPPPGTRVIKQGAQADLDATRAREVIARLEGESVGYELRVKLAWTIQSKDGGAA